MSDMSARSRSAPGPLGVLREWLSEDTAKSLAPNAQPVTTAALFLVSTLFGFYLLRVSVDFIATDGIDYTWAWVAVITLVTLPALRANYADLPAYGKRFFHASAVFLAFYFTIEPFDIPYAAIPADHPGAVFHQAGRWIGLALALIGFRVPAAVFASAMVLWLVREMHTTLTGFYFSTLDIRNVAEVIAVVALGASYASAARRTAPLRAAFALDDAVIARIVVLLLAVGIGGHLGNYFFSAVAKLSLDGGPLSWLIGNRLQDGMIGAIERGTMPWSASPTATSVAHGVVDVLNTPMNIASFLFQFAAILAPWRKKWLLAVTLTYDLFHFVVYVAFGLLFWKWMALNTIIVVTLWILPDDVWDRAARITCIMFVLIGVVFFKVATLAWYDAGSFMSVFWEAELKDGSRVRIPNAYFNSASYQASQGRFYVPPVEGHFNHAIWGSVLHWDDVQAARTCEPPKRDGPAPELYGPVDALTRYIQAHHEKTLRRVDDRGIYNYYYLPHHHMPAPFLKDPFLNVDKRQIAAYDYVVESVCLGLEEGKMTRDVKKRDVFRVYETE
ncbi:MAG: hypothetical protein AAFQ67_04765 [Pseudomonadota bacterium]